MLHSRMVVAKAYEAETRETKIEKNPFVVRKVTEKETAEILKNTSPGQS